MGQFKKLQAALDEELHDEREQLDELEQELGYLEHEVSQLLKKIELQKDLIFAKESDINRRYQELALNFEDRI